jgi:nitrous oxidase accessory protein
MAPSRTQDQAIVGAEAAGAKAPAAPDRIASLTIAIVGSACLLLSWILPWWAMAARAPQYGQRVLIVQVNPQTVKGDVYEIDSLGHYVGIRPIASVANLERKLGPIGLGVAIICFLTVPFLRKKRLRFLFVLPAILMPIVFFADLKYWVAKSASERDPEAALNLTVQAIETKIFGKYEVGQFKVSNSVQGGVYVAGVAAALGLGLIFAVPLSFRRRKELAAFGAIGMFGLMHPLDANASIQVMIDSALEGGTVTIPSGVHYEHLVVTKPIRLIGEPGAVIDGGNTGTILKITAPGVTVENVTLQNSGDTYTTEDAAIRIENAPGVRIANTEILNTLFGFFVMASNDCELTGNRLVGKDLPSEKRGDGIRLWYSHGCKILKNHVERSRDVVIWYSNDTRVEKNLVTTSRYGLHYMYSDRNSFYRNRFEHNEVGAAIMYSRNLTLSENTFSFSNGVSAYGLLLKDADDVFIRGNRFVGNATALFFDNAPQSRGSRVVVNRNWIARNDVGATVEPNTHDIEFSENSFVGNRTQVSVAGSGSAEKNFWDVDGRGNYWSDAVVYDRNGDGISEIPYRVEATFEVLSERYPAVAFFDGTPASQALDMGARLFPIFAPRPKFTDSHPLVSLETEERPEGAKNSSRGMSVAGTLLLSTVGLVFTRNRKVLS